MYICEDNAQLEQYRNQIENGFTPKEDELPMIYVEYGGKSKINLQAEYGSPYYDEIDINLINETNSSCARKQIYSNYLKFPGEFYKHTLFLGGQSIC